jgi:ABC-type nitrate/sulfonate/bicarbonate transport system permease component
MRVPGIIFDIWLDAQHLYMVIAQRAVELPALHAVAATAAIAATAATRRTRTRPTLRRVVAGAAGAAAAGRARGAGTHADPRECRKASVAA